LRNEILTMAPAFKKTSRAFIPGALLCLAMMSGISFSADIYKIIDEDGNVTYSSTPPNSSDSVEAIQTMSPPSESGYEAARQRQQETRDYLASLDSARLAQAELEYRMRASRPATFVQSSTMIMPATTYLPRHRFGYSRDRGRTTGWGGHTGIGSVDTPPMRNQWGRTISHSWD
jgi:hypothetical protein